MARHGGAWLGEAWQGMAGRGKARQGFIHSHLVDDTRRGKARLGKARLGLAWQGEAWLGKARQGKVLFIVILSMIQGMARRGGAGQGSARHGVARHGKARQGKDIKMKIKMKQKKIKTTEEILEEIEKDYFITDNHMYTKRDLIKAIQASRNGMIAVEDVLKIIEKWEKSISPFMNYVDMDDKSFLESSNRLKKKLEKLSNTPQVKPKSTDRQKDKGMETGLEVSQSHSNQSVWNPPAENIQEEKEKGGIIK